MRMLWKLYVYSLIFRLGRCYPALETSGSTPLTSTSKTFKDGLEANELPGVVENVELRQSGRASEAPQSLDPIHGAHIEDTLTKGFEGVSEEQNDHPHGIDVKTPIFVSRPSTIEEAETTTSQPKDSTNCFKKAWRSVSRVASRSLGPLWERTKAFFAKIFDFFCGKGTEADTPSGMTSGPKEEDERNAIAQKFIGAAGPLGEAPPEWFKGLETSFRTLPSVSEAKANHKDFKQTRDFIIALVTSLVTMPVSLQQREVLMSALNHITSYNPAVKSALYRAALGKKPANRIVFKTLALTIADIRPGRLPDTSVKHSFEADWFKQSPEVEERYHRILLVDSQPKGLSPEVKRLAEQLEHCPNVQQWTKEDNKGLGDVKVIMMTAIKKMKDFQDIESEEDLIYTYQLVQYICNVNKHAKVAFEKELLNEEIRQPVVKALILLYSDRLFENVPGNSLEMKILSDPTLGPLMDRTFLQQTIPKKSMPEEIRELADKILGLDSKLKTWAPDPTSSNSVQELLNRLLLLMTPNPGEELKLRFSEKIAVIDLLAYLDRWNPFVRVEIRRHLYANPTFLKVLSSMMCKYYPDGVLETASKTTFYYKLLEGTTLAERVPREGLISSAIKTKNSQLIVISSPLEKLENGWYTQIVDNQPQKMVEGLLDFINRNKWETPKSPVMVSIKILQHLTYYKPDLKKSLLTEINDQRKLQLRSNLRKYCQETQMPVKSWEGVFTRSQRGYTNDFVEWLREIPIMSDLERDAQPSSTSAALMKTASNHLKMISSHISGSTLKLFPTSLGEIKQVIQLGPLREKLGNVGNTIQQKASSYVKKFFHFLENHTTG